MLLVISFARVRFFFPYSFPLGVEGWLWFMIVAYLIVDLSINFFIVYSPICMKLASNSLVLEILSF